MNDTTYHIPALLEPTIDILDIKRDGVYVDATLGGAGHTRAILQHLGPDGRLFGFDRDMQAIANAPEDSRFQAVHSDFRYMPNFLKFYGVDGADGILADLGVSFHHFDDASRGFSFREDAPLDMRMNQRAERSAADIVAEASPEELRQIIADYTDLPRPDRIADAIVKARLAADVDTTFRLVQAVEPTLHPARRKKELAQVFQAFRIAVNDEMAGLRALLENSLRVLKPGGVLAVLTYHSLEDRLVKRFMRSGTLQGEPEKDFYGKINTPWINLTKNGITADSREVEENPRARSARLRAARLKDDFTN